MKAPPTLGELLEHPRDQRQRLVTHWAREAFGEAEATDLAQRGVRLLEEAIEAFQACGGDEVIALKLVSFVFARPAGTVGQELGGVAVTTLALAAAASLSADEEECREIARVLSKPIAEFSARNANKNAAGFKMTRCPWAGCSTPYTCNGMRHRQKPCCDSANTYCKDGREYCQTCGLEVL